MPDPNEGLLAPDFEPMAPDTEPMAPDFPEDKQKKGRMGLGVLAAARAGAYGTFGQVMSMNALRHMGEPHTQKEGKNLNDAFQAGFQASNIGLLGRGKLPDVYLDPHHATRLQKAAQGMGQIAGDLPTMILAGLGIGAVTAETGPGAAVAGGAASFAAPAAVREALTMAYTLDQVDTPAEFLDRTTIAAKAVGKDAVVGGLTGGAGHMAKVFGTSLGLGGKIGGAAMQGPLTPMAARAVGAGAFGAEYVTMAAAPKLLEGQLPDKEDFINAALIVGGMKLAHKSASGLLSIYKKTGVRPEQVLADAKVDPTIVDDLRAEPPHDMVARILGPEGYPEWKQRMEADPLSQGMRHLDGDRAVLVAGGEAAPQAILDAAHETGSEATSHILEAVRGHNMNPEPGRNGKFVVIGPGASGKTYEAAQLAQQPGTRFALSLGLHRSSDPIGHAIAMANAGEHGGVKPTVVFTFNPDLAQVAERYAERTKVEGREIPLGQMAADWVDSPAKILQGAIEHEGKFDLVFKDTSTGNEYHGPEAVKQLRNMADQLKEVTHGQAEDALRSGIESHAARGPVEVRSPEGDAQRGGTAEAAGDGGGAAPAPVEPHADIPKAYRPMASLQAALEALPGEGKPEVLDTPWGEQPTSRLKGYINTKYIEGPEDLVALLNRMSEVYGEEFGQLARTETWEETTEKTKALADLAGTDPKALLESLGGTDNLAAKVGLLSEVLMDATTRAGNAIREYKKAGANATEAMKVEALEAIHRLSMIQGSVLQQRNEIGRALNFMKNLKQIKEGSEGISKLADLYGELTPEELLDLANNTDTPEALGRFGRKLNQPTKLGMAIEYWKGAVLGPLAFGKKFASDVAMVVMQPIIDTVAYGESKFLPGAKAEMSGARGAARLVGNYQAAKDALKSTLALYKALGPIEATKEVGGEFLFGKDEGGLMGNRQQIPGKLGKAARMSFNSIEFITEYFKTLQSQGEAYALAADAAAKEGHSFATKEFWEAVHQKANNPDPVLQEHLDAFGQRMTFGDKLGPAGKALNKMVQEIPVLEFVIPFRKAPTNVVKQEIRLSPLAPLVGSWRADVKAGGVAAARAYAEMTIGTSIAALGFGWASSGKVSGAGDPDPAKRATQMASGWQPHSVNINGKWYSYGKVHPLGMVMGAAADIHEMWAFMDKGEQDRALKALQHASAEAIKEQAFLQGVQNMAEALDTAEGKGQKFLQNFVAGWVPFGGAQSATAAAMDPHMREVQSVLDAVKNKIPGLRETLPPKRDLFGAPVPEPERMGGISPIKVSEPTDDKVRLEAARLGIASPKTPKTLHLAAAGQKDIGKVELTPEQRDIFGQKSGEMAYSVLKPIVESPGWEHLSKGAQITIYNKVLSATRKEGGIQALPVELRTKEYERIMKSLDDLFAEP